MVRSGPVRTDTHLPDRFTLTDRLQNESLLFVLTDRDTRRDHLLAGMAMERAWLTAVSRRLAVSVITQPWQLPEVRTALTSRLRFAATPQVLLRVGHPAVTTEVPLGAGPSSLTFLQHPEHRGVVTVIENHRVESTARPATTVRTGPGVAPDAMTYVQERLLDLEHYAPRPIDTIDATVNRPRDRKHPNAVEVRATLSLGRHVLRVRTSKANLRAALDDVYDRLQRQLTELPHGNRGDYVTHRKPTMSEPSQRKPGLRVHRADVDGHHPWMLEDDAGILEVAESLETLAADHPLAHLTDDTEQS